MLNPQLAQHLALLQDDEDGDGNDDDDKYEAEDVLVPVTRLPETAKIKDTSKSLRCRFLAGVFKPHNLSAYGIGVVAVAVAAVVLPVVLPTSPVYRGLVMGLAVAIFLMHHHYYSQTPLWNNEGDNIESESNRSIRSLQHQRQKQDSRVRLSTLLGLMGAPPLSGEAAEEETSDATTTLHCHYLQYLTFLEDFAQANAGLVETVDQTMDILKRATAISLGLGLGWRAQASASVERVELAAMSRVRRRQMSGTTVNTLNTGMNSRTGFSLSLSRLRHTLYRLMTRQKALLLSILDDLNEGSVYSDDEAYSREDPQDPIVTLALLRRGRNDLVHILGMILDRCSRSTKKENRHLLSESTIQSQQHLSMSLASEARAHLLASLSLSSQCSERERTPFQMRVSDLHAQVDALQVALIGCHDESVTVSEKDCALGTDETQAAKWWEHVNNLLDEVDATRRTVEQEFFPSSLEPASDANLENGFDEKGGARSMEERQEFKADGQPIHHPIEQSPDAQGQKTFIFSGSGAVAPRRKRVEKPSPVSYEKPIPAQDDSYFMEQSLMHELRSHLQAMPPAEEVNVVETEVPECYDDVEGVQRVVENEAANMREVSGVASVLLLKELKASLISLSKEEQYLEWEVPSYTVS